MEKIDFKKKFKNLYSASGQQAVIIDVPSMNFLMIDGKGGPGGQAFQDATQALYGMSFTGKFALKEDPKTPDYVVPPLEGL